MDEGPAGLISPLAVDKSLITFAFHSLTRPAFPPKSPGEKRKDGRAKAPPLRRRGDCGSEKTPPGERGLGSLSQDLSAYVFCLLDPMSLRFHRLQAVAGHAPITWGH
jgi:hypothetical protein